MAAYSQDDLNDDWEFKIVRSIGGAFHNPDVLNQLLQEESRAGWVMLEKFDDSRIRFKRRCSSRANDARLPPEIDPYRTSYGAPPNLYASRLVMLAMLIVMLVISLGMALILVMRGH